MKIFFIMLFLPIICFTQNQQILEYVHDEIFQCLDDRDGSYIYLKFDTVSKTMSKTISSRKITNLNNWDIDQIKWNVTKFKSVSQSFNGNKNILWNGIISSFEGKADTIKYIFRNNPDQLIKSTCTNMDYCCFSLLKN